ncbi:hypothetical protein [Streptomyces sp. NPDC090798]|uniref:hypothetical protein n=1 Tax=Streptomyces sp. NPDC090798 TaxID=3365968 RepID=UPI00381290D0
MRTQTSPPQSPRHAGRLAWVQTFPLGWGAVVIEIEKLAKVFGNRTLWSEVAFTVKHGEMIALIGPSGSGNLRSLTVSACLKSQVQG